MSLASLRLERRPLPYSPFQDQGPQVVAIVTVIPTGLPQDQEDQG